jgi:hypothetical protein
MLLAACGAAPTVAGYEKMLGSWVGADEVELVREWGAPDRSYEAAGRRFVTYSARRLQHYPGTQPLAHTAIVNGVPHTVITGGSMGWNEERSCSTTFELDGGKVVAWSHRGDDCLAAE